MKVHEVMSEVRHLSVEDRKELLEFLRETLRENGAPDSGTSSLYRLRGILKPDGSIPSDDELAAIYSDHLMKKYT